MIKRVVMLCGLALSVVAVALTPVASGLPGDDASGPSCANFTGGSFLYDGTNVTGSAQLGAPACKQITYTVYVLDQPGGTVLTSSSTPTILPNGNVQFTIPVSDTDGVVCIYGTTSTNGGKVHDRAPDTGCIEISAGSGGTSGWN